jgi:acetyl-CoA carboxylase beta subunit
MPAPPFSRLSARARAAALADPGTLDFLIGSDESRAVVAAARARIAGRALVLVLTDGHQRGGTIGLAEARQFSTAVSDAERHRAAVVVCWDTGGGEGR